MSSSLDHEELFIKITELIRGYMIQSKDKTRKVRLLTKPNKLAYLLFNVMLAVSLVLNVLNSLCILTILSMLSPKI